MILYHGTALHRLDSILKSGLLPRGRGRKGNWDGCARSHDGYTYLSSWMPVYYAANAMQGNEDRAVILKVEVDEVDLYPDEDFVFQNLSHALGKPLEDLQQRVKLDRYKKVAKASLAHYGSVATRFVLPGKILAHHVLSPGLRIWGALGGDIVPALMTYRILGKQYERRLEILFEQGEEAAQADEDNFYATFKSLP